MNWEQELEELRLEIEEAEMDLAAFGGSYSDELRLEKMYRRARELERRIAEWYQELDNLPVSDDDNNV